MHIPFWQMLPIEQSSLVVQLVRHAVSPHAYGAHGTSLVAGQVPIPSQVAGRVAVPFIHAAARHDVVLGGYTQAVRLVPLQLPPHDVPAPVHAARIPRGTPVAAVHVPTLPSRLHASHCPLQPVLQHTPSTQLPLLHSRVAEHVPPLGRFGTHCIAVLQ